MGGRVLDNNRRGEAAVGTRGRRDRLKDGGRSDREGGGGNGRNGTEGELNGGVGEQEAIGAQRRRELGGKGIDGASVLKQVWIQCYTTTLSNFTSVNQPRLHILLISQMVFCPFCLLDASLVSNSSLQSVTITVLY